MKSAAQNVHFLVEELNKLYLHHMKLGFNGWFCFFTFDRLLMFYTVSDIWIRTHRLRISARASSNKLCPYRGSCPVGGLLPASQFLKPAEGKTGVCFEDFCISHTAKTGHSRTYSEPNSCHLSQRRTWHSVWQ